MKSAWVMRNAPAISASGDQVHPRAVEGVHAEDRSRSRCGLEGGDDEHQRERDQADRLADRDAAVVVLAERDQRQVGDGDEQPDRGRR